MSAALKPPEIEISLADSTEDSPRLKTGARTPRPYHHDGDEILQDGNEAVRLSVNDAKISAVQDERDNDEQWQTISGRASTAGSDSGTEADDERQTFVKALPAPHLRPRKGLKAGEQSDDVLLTPSQLDDEGRRLSQDYFRRTSRDRTISKEEANAEQEKLLRIRLAEFVRRTSEVALMSVIALTVLCGKGVLQVVVASRRELLTHVLIIVGLVLAYPVKLSIVDSASQARKLWQRFRVPASFDPATVLYPPLLPVLVALALSPADPTIVLLNVILGLASLPQRLFPRSSRLGGINAFHWFISILPLIIGQYMPSPSVRPNISRDMHKDSVDKALNVETLVSLYPLHHALLQPLQYMTSTSLLASESHLLCASLINLLLLAQSPQTTILKACLWIGGLPMFICCAPILHWNLALIRIPRWKFRRPGHPAEEQKSLVDSVSDLINLQRTTSLFTPSAIDDSDADEDRPNISIQPKPTKRPQLNISSFRIPAIDLTGNYEPQSAIEPRKANGAFADPSVHRARPRRNTLPARETSEKPHRQPSSRRSERASSPWFANLTASQANRRKWTYAIDIYAFIVAIVLLPVRSYVMVKALHDHEPVGWAISYLLGQLKPLRSWFVLFDLEGWIPLPINAMNWQGVQLSFPLDVPSIRDDLGPATVRLLLIAYWGIVLLGGLLTVFSLTAFVEVDTRRKVFHGVMVAMMLPATFVDPCACALALVLILAVFLLLEIIRAGQVPPLGSAIGRFVAPYVDGRDLRGPVVISHFFLLIGCAVPLWFSLASISRTGGPPWEDWELVDEKREVAMLAGVICVGMGDAAASLIGRRYGRRKWMWVGGKSLEGSAAFAAAVTVGLIASKAWLVVGGWNDNTGSLSYHLGEQGALQLALAWLKTTAKALYCACGASFMEAVLTGANDNVVVPVALWLLVKGVRL